MKLLPLKTRVTHFDGGPGTHGKGTIVAYNGIKPNEYLNNNFKDAVVIADHAGLLGTIINSLYDGVKCPYVVQWDYNADFFERYPELKDKYPDGYKDVYEPTSIQLLQE